MGLVIAGAILAAVIQILGIPVLPFAIGVYLPVQLNACIMVGGLVRLYYDKKSTLTKKQRQRTVNRGILYCSGMIAGEGLVGILLAVFAVLGLSDAMNLGSRMNLSAGAGKFAALVVFALIVLLVIRFTNGKKENA